MQFKHPEILWALLLLLLPIFIHLFQLRRFKKTPFTNVAMLQRVISESRKSNQLKKWLLLLCRLGLLAALVLAFAQPFTANRSALQAKETVIYLDNSFSMQAKNEGLPLLEKAVQELIKNTDETSVFSLFTNDQTFRGITLKDVQNKLLALGYTDKQLDLNAVQLKANALFSADSNTKKRLIVFSDFQKRNLDSLKNNTISGFLVKLEPDFKKNVSIDSLYFNKGNTSQTELVVQLSGNVQEGTYPISLYNNQNLIAKTAASFESQNSSEVIFSIPTSEAIKGHVTINDKSLNFDNELFFNIDKKNTINVMAITESDPDYLQRLFDGEEFNLSIFRLNQLNYSFIDQQNTIIVDGLLEIPNSLQKAFKNFHENGGNLIIIPGVDSNITSYNQFLSSFSRTRLGERFDNTQKITAIAYGHPLYKNVFEKEVFNFQSPEVKTYFSTSSNLSPILSLQSGESFLMGSDRLYLFSGPLEAANSNFKNSPLIVPTFYNMAVQGLKNAAPYFVIGEEAVVDLDLTLGPDNILSLSKKDVEWIPRQRSYSNKIALYFGDAIAEEGTYGIQDKDSTYGNISFNYNRTESDLKYANMEHLYNWQESENIGTLFEQLAKENTVTPYWKWFVILALIFALFEILVQKFIS